MNHGRYVFSQLLDHLPRHDFDLCRDRYPGRYRHRTFSAFDQYLCMAFAQLTYRESLRDIATCLNALKPKLYHVGFRGPVARSTLADANEARDWRIHADFAQVLIAEARKLHAGDSFGVELGQAAYAFDSTTIDLCLKLFPWAPFRRRKAAVKLHTLIDLRGNIPCFIHITDGKTHDVNALDHLPVEPGAFYMMDRGYLDFARLRRFGHAAAFFVTRAKTNMDFARRASRPVDKQTGLRCDQDIRLRGVKSAKAYPESLRRIGYRDPETGRELVFLTNNFVLPALTFAQLYKSRWQVELFFKWIKQNLRIKAFYGYSDNAVRTQVWIAVGIYALILIVRKNFKSKRSPSEILQILSLSLFEKVPLQQALASIPKKREKDAQRKPLSLFDI